MSFLRTFAQRQLEKYNLEDKMEVNQKDSAGRTPLHLAGQRGNVSVIRRRLEEGANPNEKDNFGRTPLHFAGNSECIEILLEHKADINAKDINGRTPLHYQHNVFAIETLLKHNAKIVESKVGLTPLDEIKQIEPDILTTAAKKEKMIGLLSEQIEIDKEKAIAEKYTSGPSSLMWLCAKKLSKIITQEQFDELPEDVQLYVKSAQPF